MFEVFLTHTADKSQKKLDKPLRVKIKEALLTIAEDPENVGEKLTSPLTNIYSHHIKYTGKEFRIAYTIDLENLTVMIHLIAAHENFYKRLKIILDR
jgi:mRNA-degrading endonuclease RelE of RelBE toxin-antitoxin system